MGCHCSKPKGGCCNATPPDCCTAINVSPLKPDFPSDWHNPALPAGAQVAHRGPHLKIQRPFPDRYSIGDAEVAEIVERVTKAGQIIKVDLVV